MLTNFHEQRGVVRGKTIELDQTTGLPDGQPVTVTVQPLSPTARHLLPGEGIQRSAGAWDDDPEGLEEFLAWSREQRSLTRPTVED